ncbi:unnamed protein product [Pedinophyceae sp. YPF-701]|nr:unnamed protein product [Pedinophyceae sp. YPF-701]
MNDMVFGTQEQIVPILDPVVTRNLEARFDQGDKIIAEYVWIDGTGMGLRSKSRTLDKSKAKGPASELPVWNYDGSSTGQAPGDDSEVYLKPQAIYKDPFRGGDNILVMCDTYEPPKIVDGKEQPMKPIPTNTRAPCEEVMKQAMHQEPWFGIEQEYTLLHPNTQWPLGWPTNGYPGPQGPYYCAAGAGRSIARDVADMHYKACLHAGIKISGVNGEVMPAQWEYQVGPCIGMEMGDMLQMSRYIMHRICEAYNVICTFDPKPVPGDWNGAGGHTNYSNNDTRAPGTGYDAIIAQCEKLKKNHAAHIAAYGEGNERRLTGLHETSSIHDFSYGVANRGCSIRIPRAVPVDKCGYYEDRRPASNLDPYVVTKMIVATTLL